MKYNKLLTLSSIALLCASMTACSGNEKKVDEGEIAAQTALDYYRQLSEGKYEAFLNGETHTENLPASYRQQLLTSLKQFIQQQDSLHKGIDSITLGSSIYSDKDSTANAFLVFHYADNSREQMVVPMVKDKGRWVMR